MAFNRTLQHFTSSQELAPLWETGQNYILNQLVLQNDQIYRCISAHLSTTFSVDLAAGDWVLVSANASGKNYLLNPDFNDGVSTYWGLFNTTLTSKIPTGSITAGAASITTFAADSTTPIEGAFDLRVASSGAITAGHGFISDAFTIDREDQAKVMGFSFAYEAVSGTMNFSGTSNNTWAVYIYDVTGGAWIQPAGVYNLTQGSGVGIASGTFQTTATGTQYRIAIICITATSGAVEMRFDNFQLGPQRVVYGSPVTDWQSVSGMTATGFGTPSVTSSFYRRVGDSYEYQVDITFGAAGTGNELNITLPPSVSIDVNKEPSALIRTAIGDGVYRNTGSGAIQTGVVYYATGVTGNTVVTFYTTSVTVASGHHIGMNFRVPVTGLSSSVQMSNDTDTRVVAFGVTNNSATTQSIGTTPTKITTMGTVNVDTHASWSTATDEYTVPVSGVYRCSAGVFGQVSPTNYRIRLNIYRDSTVMTEGIEANHSAVNQDLNPQTSGTFFCNAGQKIALYADVNSGTATVGGFIPTFLSIERLSGPATIAASETVASLYGNSAGTTLVSATNTLIPFATRFHDTTNSFSGSTFTVPISGKYRVALSAYTASTGNVTADFQLNIYKNGSLFIGGNFPKTGTAGVMAGVMSSTVGCNAGDTIQAYIYNGTAANVNLIANVAYNWFLVERVGN
jgi:hypothetical protein